MRGNGTEAERGKDGERERERVEQGGRQGHTDTDTDTDILNADADVETNADTNARSGRACQRSNVCLWWSWGSPATTALKRRRLCRTKLP